MALDGVTLAEASRQPSGVWRLDSRALRGSFLIHASLATAYLLLVILPQLLSGQSRTEVIGFDVIEAPRVAPQPLEAAPPKPEKKAPQPRSVFGLSRKAMTSSSDDSAPTAKAGNTLAKEQDREKLRPDDADSLPIPTDEYLVSEMPVLISDFRVPYPPDARKAGVQGAVILDLLIDGEGRVRQAAVAQKLFPSLDDAALKAASSLKFKPARVAEKTVAVRIRYAYRFVLE
jgi:protein TonB